MKTNSKALSTFLIISVLMYVDRFVDWVGYLNRVIGIFGTVIQAVIVAVYIICTAIIIRDIYRYLKRNNDI